MSTLDRGQSLDAADELIAAYVAGSLSLPLNVLVASHLELQPEQHALVSAMESDCGEALHHIEPTPIDKRAQMLQAIFASSRAQNSSLSVYPNPETLPALPRALGHYVGRPFADLHWRRVMPGLKEVLLAEHEEGTASLLMVGAGQRMPEHSHKGREYTLVISGRFSDDQGHYQRGDICIADSDVRHSPRADKDEDCLCFAVTDAPLRLTGPFGRLIQPFLKN